MGYCSLDQDMPTEYGSALYEGNQPNADASIVAIIRMAGALILGNTPEICGGIYSNFLQARQQQQNSLF